MKNLRDSWYLKGTHHFRDSYLLRGLRHFSETKILKHLEYLEDLGNLKVAKQHEMTEELQKRSPKYDAGHHFHGGHLY